MKNKQIIVTNLHQYPFIKRIHDRYIIFIHIPKTGGTSISKALNMNPPNRELKIRKHYSVINIEPHFDPEIWRRSFRFCFVRNPWDRLYSHFRYRRLNRKLKRESHYRSFKKWLRYELIEDNTSSNLMPQIEWLKNAEDQILMDFIGRYENLEADFKKVCQLIYINTPLPHLLSSGLRVNYRLQYDQESADIVAEYYRSDIEYFSYKF